MENANAALDNIGLMFTRLGLLVVICKLKTMQNACLFAEYTHCQGFIGKLTLSHTLPATPATANLLSTLLNDSTSTTCGHLRVVPLRHKVELL